MFSEITIYAWKNPYHSIILILHLTTIMYVTDYWPMAWEYSVWNATVTALQFWNTDLKAHVLSSAIEQVYNTLFYSTSTHLLHQQWDEVLFSHFMTTLNAAFESKLTWEDTGYKSGSENFNIPTPLRKTSRIHYISSDENISFEPVTPYSTHTGQSHCKPIWHQLTFSSSNNNGDTSTADNSSPSSTVPLQNPMDFLQQPHSSCTLTIHDDIDDDKEEEDFQTISIEDDHWSMEEIPNWPLCIHEHSALHDLCPYPCPYLDYTSSPYCFGAIFSLHL